MVVIYSGWMCVGGTEVINNERANAYAGSRCAGGQVLCRCPGLPRIIGDGPYTTAAADDAPWFDEAIDESGDVIGIIGLDFDGFNRGTLRRKVDTSALGGGVIRPAVRGPREFTVKAAILAKTECAASYARAWLAAVLAGDTCGDGCDGDTVQVLSCCPPPLPDGATGDEYVRTLRRVVLMEGPEVTDYTRSADLIIVEVEWTMAAAEPWFYTLAAPAVAATTICGAMVEAAGDDPDCAKTAVSCIADPDCPPIPLPEALPVPKDPCQCGPTTRTGNAIAIPAAVLPESLDAVPVVQVYSGAQVLRCLVVRFFSNPYESPPEIVAADPCNACWEVRLPYLPAYTTLTVDAASRRASANCRGVGGVDDVTGRLGGAGTTPLDWPVFTCGAPMVVQVLSDAEAHDCAGTITVGFIGRQDLL